MTVTWRFGNLEVSSFRDEEQTGFSEVTPDAGLPFRREVFTDINNLVTGQKTLSLLEYNDFRHFYRNETRQGTLPFTFYDCRVGTNRVARFIGKPSYSALSNKFTISVTLSLEPVTIITTVYMITEGGARITTEDGAYIMATQGNQL